MEVAWDFKTNSRGGLTPETEKGAKNLGPNWGAAAASPTWGQKTNGLELSIKKRNQNDDGDTACGSLKLAMIWAAWEIRGDRGTRGEKVSGFWRGCC